MGLKSPVSVPCNVVKRNKITSRWQGRYREVGSEGSLSAKMWGDGFRPGRSAHDGVKQIKQYIRQGYKVAVDMDLSKFFDTVNHDVLMHRVSRRIHDKRVLKLIGKYLRAGVMVNGRRLATPLGVPQGGPLSPLVVRPNK